MYTFTLHHFSIGNDEFKTTLELTKKAIDGVDDFLLYYYTEVAQALAPTRANETYEELNKHRLRGESAALSGATKTHLMFAWDAYDSATQEIHEIFGFMKPLLNSFNRLIYTNAEGAQNIIVRTFDNGKFLKVQTELEEITSHLRCAAEKITRLRSLFQNKSDEEICKLSDQLLESYQKANTSIDVIINKLKEEFKVIDDLKSQIDKSNSPPTTTDDFAVLRDSVVQSSQKFAADYDEHKSDLIPL